MYITRTLQFALPILLAISANAQEVYRTIDEDGRVIFSDIPQQHSEQIEVKPTNIQPAIKPTAPIRKTRQTESIHYHARLSSPDDGQLYGPGQRSLSMSLSLSPALHSDHQIEFWLDGKRVGGPSSSSSASLNMGIKMRGRHQVSAKVIDSDGNTVVSTPSVTIHVVRPN